MTTITMKEVAAFLLGEAPLDGAWFGDTRPSEHGQFWWRKHLRAALAAPATAPVPAWHDAPTVPGVWLCDEGDICYTWTAHNIEILDQFDPGDGLRWYGPIPPDGEQP